MRTGQTRRRDINEKVIVAALVAIGAHVTRVSGEGAPDLLIRYQGRLVAVEVKGPHGKPTQAQQGTNWPIVRSVDEALAVVGVTG